MKSSDRVILSLLVLIGTMLLGFFVAGFFAMGGSIITYFVPFIAAIIAIALDYRILIKSFDAKKTALIIGALFVIPIILILGYFTGNDVLYFIIGSIYELFGVG